MYLAIRSPREAAVAAAGCALLDREAAVDSTGHGSPLPQLKHGGPGRAGGGEELGGIRAVKHFLQRAAVQGSPTMLTAVTGEYVRGAEVKESEVHPFRRWFEDLEIGHSLLTHRRTVSEADIVNFGGVSGDYFYMHFDEIAAKDTQFGKRIAHGALLIGCDGINSAINTFTTHHPDDADQVSYHMLIGEKGQIVQALDPARRAFGAGYSAFRGRWAVTNPAMAGSVNNFALHLSLETPIDGENEAPGHSGYTTAQYDSMAVVLADWMRRFNIAPDAITTHRHVDLGLERADPRSFDWGKLQTRLAALGMLCR